MRRRDLKGHRTAPITETSNVIGAAMGPVNAAKAYAQIGVETGVHAADPVKLVLMLYDGALLAITDAQRHMAAGGIAAKGQAISRAISIIDGGLKVSLDTSRGGAIATQLFELYEYMGRRLLLASLRNDPAGLAEIAGLLRELRSAWAELAANKPGLVTAASPSLSSFAQAVAA
jgi:flagellar protein FliS